MTACMRPDDDIRRVRREVRAARRAIRDSERSLLSHRICLNIARSGALSRVRRVACFWPNDGEVDLSPLFPRLWQTGRRVYLPVIAGPRLWFAPFTPDTRLADNRFGIPEPAGRRRGSCPVMALDLVLVPLVAFDTTGIRVGMGGGYYDRTFAYLRHRLRLRRPRLVGVAFSLQRRERLPARPWDVPLDGAATDAGFEWFHRARGPRARIDNGGSSPE